MHLEHQFSSPAGLDQAWRVLVDLERSARCVPGATIDSVAGDTVTGAVKVKLGPLNLTYRGEAVVAERDDAGRRMVVRAHGEDARNGTVTVTWTITLAGAEGATSGTVGTELEFTGKPAQFSRGVMVDVGQRLVAQFAERLTAAAATGDGASVAPAAEGAAASTPQHEASAATAPRPKRARPKPTPAPTIEETPVAPADDPEPQRDLAPADAVEPVLIEAAAPADDGTPADAPAVAETPGYAAPVVEPDADEEPVVPAPGADTTPSYGTPGGFADEAVEAAAAEHAAQTPAISPKAAASQPGPSQPGPSQPGPSQPGRSQPGPSPLAKRLAPVAVALWFVLAARRRRRRRRSTRAVGSS